MTLRIDQVPPRLAVLGARKGRQGLGEHLARFAVRHGARIPCFLGTSEETVAEAGEVLRARGIEARGYVDVAEMLALEALDGLVISSPAGTHFEYLTLALEHGLHVLCEKPLVWGTGDDSARAASFERGFADLGLVLRENCQWPYTLPAFRELHPDAPSAPSEKVWTNPRGCRPCSGRPSGVLNRRRDADPSSSLDSAPDGLPGRGLPPASRSFGDPHRRRGGLSAPSEGTFEMWLCPSSRGGTMLVDAMSHPVSLLQALLPGDDVSLERLRFSTRDPDAETLGVQFRYLAGGDKLDVIVRLESRASQPRPAGYAVTGRRAERRVRMDDYALFFDDGGRSVPVPDPMERLVKDFVVCVAAGGPGTGRDVGTGNEIGTRARLLHEIVTAYENDQEVA